jgi:hypothetical protein
LEESSATATTAATEGSKMDNITAVINRKVWNFIEDASEQACAEYGVNEKEVWSDGKRFGYLQEFADHLIQETAEWNRTDSSVRLQATDYVRAVIMQFAA